MTGKAFITIIVSVLVVLVLGGAALAAIPDSGKGTFHGCYSKTTGALRLVDPAKSQKCASGEKAITWDQTGLTWLDTWSPSVQYTAYDAVTYNGSSYLAISTSTGKTPSSNKKLWALLARAGSTGVAGRPGGPGVL